MVHASGLCPSSPMPILIGVTHGSLPDVWNAPNAFRHRRKRGRSLVRVTGVVRIVVGFVRSGKGSSCCIVARTVSPSGLPSTRSRDANPRGRIGWMARHRTVRPTVPPPSSCRHRHHDNKDSCRARTVHAPVAVTFPPPPGRRWGISARGRCRRSVCSWCPRDLLWARLMQHWTTRRFGRRGMGKAGRLPRPSSSLSTPQRCHVVPHAWWASAGCSCCSCGS
jgi:hypothetical protein